MLERLQKFFTTTLIGGVVVILPIAIVVTGFMMVLNFINKVTAPIANLPIFQTIDSQWLISVISFTILVGFCFLVGLSVRTRMGEKIYATIEKNYLVRVPLYPIVKETVQQFTGNKKMPFSKVVKVDVFGNGTRMLGFITDEHDSGNLTVFVPTGPNPTNGFIFMVEEDQVEIVKIKPEEAMRMIIGVGTGTAGNIDF